MQSVLRHVHEVHPDMAFGSHDADLLVSSGAYDDTEHTKTEKQSWADFAGNTGGAFRG